jgi:hypothetical protein
LAPEWRGNLEQIRQIKVADPRGRHIPLEQLAELAVEDGPAQISRESVRRRTLIQCNVRGRDLAGFVAAGLGLSIAARAVIRDEPWTIVALGLTIAFIAHVYDLYRRFRGAD